MGSEHPPCRMLFHKPHSSCQLSHVHQLLKEWCIRLRQGRASWLPSQGRDRPSPEPSTVQDGTGATGTRSRHGARLLRAQAHASPEASSSLISPTQIPGGHRLCSHQGGHGAKALQGLKLLGITEIPPGRAAVRCDAMRAGGAVLPGRRGYPSHPSSPTYYVNP